MRTKENLAKFGYGGKSNKEKEMYAKRVFGTTNTDDDSDEEGFDETLDNGDRGSGNPEKISKESDAKSTWGTWLKHNYKSILITVVAIPIVLWILSVFIGYGRDISKLDEGYDNVKSNIDSLSEKYDKINDKTIRSEVLLEQIKTDLSLLKQRITSKGL